MGDTPLAAELGLRLGLPILPAPIWRCFVILRDGTRVVDGIRG